MEQLHRAGQWIANAIESRDLAGQLNGSDQEIESVMVLYRITPLVDP